MALTAFQQVWLWRALCTEAELSQINHLCGPPGTWPCFLPLQSSLNKALEPKPGLEMSSPDEPRYEQSMRATGQTSRGQVRPRCIVPGQEIKGSIFS